ncbi:hypothetical protein F5Y03DRAFT_270641 [Xylaria venustula]|nr:hypothetical protein F5Y03DRAFT_270641 [Xylaria venustula]
MRKLDLVQQYPQPENEQATERAAVDIIALHGLNAQSPRTWEAFKDGKTAESGNIFWLKDHNMLPSAIPNSRILTNDYNASYTTGASEETLTGHAVTLLYQLDVNRKKAHRSNRLIIFIASCFGGLLLAKALITASRWHPLPPDS